MLFRSRSRSITARGSKSGIADGSAVTGVVSEKKGEQVSQPACPLAATAAGQFLGFRWKNPFWRGLGLYPRANQRPTRFGEPGWESAAHTAPPQNWKFVHFFLGCTLVSASSQIKSREKAVFSASPPLPSSGKISLPPPPQDQTCPRGLDIGPPSLLA